MTTENPNELPEQFLLRKYALIGARHQLAAIEQERERLLALFPELAEPRSDVVVAATVAPISAPITSPRRKTNGHAKVTPKERAWTTTGLPTLRLFFETGPSTPKDVARASKITVANATWRIRVQVAAGHLRKTEAGKWELTEKGRAAYQARESSIIESPIQ